TFRYLEADKMAENKSSRDRTERVFDMSTVGAMNTIINDGVLHMSTVGAMNTVTSEITHIPADKFVYFHFAPAKL
ncbi:MAG: hypothetical protein N0E48_25300, partial [Candidatus Thiodiazotropha endolucinida]|nr:hypothetical protein [Candidatus Thiodiazotropha taylori]MCW4346643.1 hypothetical protein [Candidatus Thiodiazotropha endolucinida]